MSVGISMKIDEYVKRHAVKYSSIRNDVVRIVPKVVLNRGLKILCSEFDVADYLSGRKGNLTPRCYMRIQMGPFFDPRYLEANAQEFFAYLHSFCSLKPDSSMLDVGCGCGMLATPLSRYLNSNGSYWGLEIGKSMVDWAKKTISSKYTNFHFYHADIFNGQYNPKGKVRARSFRFPYERESFDIVVVKSVFTHMLPEDMENYLTEISRVLKENGTCLATYFLLNPESLNLINANLSSFEFRYDWENCRVNDKLHPEIAVAYDQEFVESLFVKLGLRITTPVRYGQWCGRTRYLSYQDVLVASKSPY